MRKILAGLVVGLLAVAPAWAAPKMRRYKIVTADGGESVMEGTKITVSGPFVLIWIGSRIDTAICAPKYVTELPPAADPAPRVEPDPLPESGEPKFEQHESTVAAR